MPAFLSLFRARGTRPVSLPEYSEQKRVVPEFCVFRWAVPVHGMSSSSAMNPRDVSNLKEVHGPSEFRDTATLASRAILITIGALRGAA